MILSDDLNKSFNDVFMAFVYMKNNDVIEQRCKCGKLIFKKTGKGLEFKCARCKRIHLIPAHLINLTLPDFCHPYEQ